MRISALLVCLLIAGQSSKPAATTPAPTPPIPAPTPAPPVAPTPAPITATQQFDDWLKVFNAGERAAIEANFKQHVAAEVQWPPMDAMMGFREQTGGFEVIKVETTTAAKYVALVKERESDQYARAELEVDAAPPNQIRSFKILAIPTPD